MSTENENEKKEADIREQFKDCLPGTIWNEEGSDDVATASSQNGHSNGKLGVTGTYKAICKKYDPLTLTEERIAEIVEENYPKYPTKNEDDEELSKLTVDECKKKRRKRSDNRTNLKAYLNEHKNKGQTDKLKDNIVVVEKKEMLNPSTATNGHSHTNGHSDQNGNSSNSDEKEKSKIISDIISIQKQLEDKGEIYEEEELKALESEELRSIAGKLANKLISQIGSDSSEVAFTFLTMVSHVAESMSPYTQANYGLDFTGVYKRHIEKKNELKKTLMAVIANNPNIQKKFTPENMLIVQLMGVYIGQAIENKTNGSLAQKK